MITKPRVSAKVVRLALIALASCIVGVAYAHQEPKIDPGNFEILGLRLGTSTIGDLKQILGPATPTKAKDPENSLMCYASPGPDRTVLQFENWTDPIEFRLFKGSAELVKECLPTDRVSASISTASGLRLGLGRDQVVALLGQPPKVKVGHWSYESSTVRPLTADEKARVFVIQQHGEIGGDAEEQRLAVGLQHQKAPEIIVEQQRRQDQDDIDGIPPAVDRCSNARSLLGRRTPK